MFHTPQDTPEKANRIFNRLLEFFKEQEINPTPLNYFVWYHYLKGDHPAFRKEMDSILKDPYGYTDRVGKRLYEQFLQDETEEDTQFDRAFRRLIDVMIKKMNLWSEMLEGHTKQLDDCVNSLANPNLNAKEIKEISNNMVSYAQSMNENSKAFQQEMLETSEEVFSLRSQLIEAQAAALTDELTELGNRKAFNNALEEHILNADQAGNPNSLCVILSDIDHFKNFNDTYGHLIGDSVLRYYANTMKKKQKGNETICRYGGEEFVILLTNSSLEEANQRAEEIRSDIEASALKRKNSSEPLAKITASFGVAFYHGQPDTGEQLVSRADIALYKAKENGRNQTIDEMALTENELN